MQAFSTTSPLMQHQSTAVAKLLPPRVGALYMEMGTGKSRTVIELARLRAAKIDHVVWMCPVSLKETVRQEILKHTDVDEDGIYVFDNKTSDTKIPVGKSFYVVGIESVSASDRVALAFNKIVTADSFVVVDESSYIKGHRALRTKRITLIGSRARYRAILTGTPFTQGVVDLYAQMSFLSPKILGYNSFWSFAANHLEYEVRKINGRERTTDRIVRSHNWDVLAEKIAPYTYQVRKSECLSLPNKIQETAWCARTEAQKYWHSEAKREFLEMADPDAWKPYHLFRLFTALQTIACGWWNRTGATGKPEVINIPHGRLGVLSGAISQIEGDERIVIWAKYRRAVDEIIKMIEDEEGKGCVARYDGTLNEYQRELELSRWRAGGSRFLVATQSAGGHGLTLTESAHAIFYADGFKYSERVQAEDRTHRIGQERRPTYVSLRCTPSIDDRIAMALATKGNALKAFLHEVDAVRNKGLKNKAIELVRNL